MRKSCSAFLLMLSLLMMSFVFMNVPNVHAEPFTIHIRADGSIDPPTANITTYDNFTYAFTADNEGGIMIERNDTVLDGAGYSLRGFQNNTWPYYYDPNDTVVAVDLPQRNNVTVQNLNIINVPHGFYLYDDTNCTIRKNNINTGGGTWPSDTGVSIFGGGSGNVIVDNAFQGWIGVDVESPGNMILRNQINNGIGVQLGFNSWSINNTVAENSFWGHTAIIVSSSIDVLYHNNFYSATPMVDSWAQTNWNETYPIGGNYWADYTGTDLFSGPFQNETGSDGIGDTAFVTANQTDNYPLMGPWIAPGENVVVKHLTGVSLNMSEVTAGGMTTFNMQTGPDPPHGTKVIGACCNVSTTASFSGTIEVTLPDYSGNITQQEERVLRIMEWNETTHSWTNITAHVDLQLHEITGQTNHLSLFAVVWRLGGDINGDFTVDIYDAIQLAGCYNTTPKSASWNPNADLNNDNVVDIYDAIILASNFNRQVS